MKNKDVSTVKKIFSILSPRERFIFGLLLLFSFVTSFIQSISIASFMPFIDMLTNENAVFGNKYIKWIYDFLGFQDITKFSIFFGFAVAVLILVSNLTVISNLIIKNRFTLSCTYKISSRLFHGYLDRPYEFILRKNTSDLVKTIIIDVNDFSNLYLSAILDFLINIIMMLFIVGMLLFVNVGITLSIIAFFILTYGTITLFSKNKLKKNGLKVMEAGRDRQRYAYEAFNGFKITKSLGVEEYFYTLFKRSTKRLTKYQHLSKLLSAVPKNIIESILFTLVIGVLILSIYQKRDLQTLIATASVYLVAGYKLMPQISSIFAAFSNILQFRPLVDRLYDEMKSLYSHLELNKPQSTVEDNLNFHDKLVLENVSFNYSESKNILENINIEIQYGSIIGFAGPTGSGKTTLIDIIMGLLEVKEGHVYVDHNEINRFNAKYWRKHIGYVPQEVFLTDSSVKLNIAFGIPENEIDDERIKLSAKIAAISNFIENELPNQYDTLIGERGSRLSGGQRQRLGLARAIYRNPQILILDEATSALDGATEESVVTNIHTHSNIKTIIIIAHRLNTLKVCDNIYLLDQGKIAENGTYNQLIENSNRFRRLAKMDKIENK